MTVQTEHPYSLSLLTTYQSVRKQSEQICAPLALEDYVVQPITDVSPPKWHLGHTTWFFENFILVPHFKGYQAFDLQLNYIFNSYYESQGPRILRSKRGNLTRPPLAKVLAYREYVDRHMESFLTSSPFNANIAEMLQLGLQHEQQHQELLVTDIKYILGNNPFFPVYQEATELDPVEATTNSWTTMEEGIYEIGHKDSGFCFDNELGHHKVYLQSFEISNQLVTNAEYMAFMDAGGYDQFQHWLSEGWEWVKDLETKAPLYWYKKEGAWWQYTLAGLKPIVPEAPVTHISYFEADAFARWKELRLPTEFEWEAACKQLYSGIPENGNFLESNNFHPTTASKKDPLQFLGNVWEWTSSAYLPYPDYPRLKGALGEYNGKFMINQMVLKGGSCATSQSHIRPTYRNFFHPDKQWQFTGIRLVK